ncbi:protein kinase 2 [Stylonychia lemnae]|uniref:Protein kinase 2 n=1 Tax=Stylonychia lemnae TaxID=5949 RepID=A0A078AIN0_STYLE|nr:protein kinase 2 [Stylonychia lemnae]|eukprot:CDW82120.1 protein kinase 2 [Stylonychia lemnae]
MGQTQCFNYKNNRQQTTDYGVSRRGNKKGASENGYFSDDASVLSTPRSPYTPNTVRKKRQNLISTMMEENKEDNLQHLFSKRLNFDNFEVIKVIGRGSYAKVYLIKKYHETNHELVCYYALKVLKKKFLHDKNQLHYILQERKILMELKHPFIVEMHYAFQSPDRLYFVLDYVSGGDMFHHIRKKVRFNEKEAKFYAAEIILAIEAMHNMGFIYRDIKPENILIDADGHVRLTDFGLSKHIDDEKNGGKTSTFCGTCQYLAPEIILKKGYNKMVDWWGLGILIHEMIFGQPPFNDSNNSRVMGMIIHNDFIPKDWFSKKLQDLLMRLLDKNPLTRLGSQKIGGVASIKNHSFFEDVNWDAVYKKTWQKPPLKLKVKNSWDTKHIDGAFLNEDIKQTPGQLEMNSFNVELLNKMHFEDFTYNEESHHLKEKNKKQLDEDLLNDIEYEDEPDNNEDQHLQSGGKISDNNSLKQEYI